MRATVSALAYVADLKPNLERCNFEEWLSVYWLRRSICEKNWFIADTASAGGGTGAGRHSPALRAVRTCVHSASGKRCCTDCIASYPTLLPSLLCLAVKARVSGFGADLHGISCGRWAWCWRNPDVLSRALRRKTGRCGPKLALPLALRQEMR